jgi:putative MATE family efflux protein
VFLLALPVLGEQLLNSAVSLFDVFLSGTISAPAQSATGFAAYVDWLASLLFGLIGTGSTALVARAAGMGDSELARRTTNQSIGLCIGLGGGATMLIYTAARTLGRLLGLDGETLDASTTYLHIASLGYVASSITLVGAACLRGAGNTVTPMWVLGLTNLVNIGVSSFLVFALSWGVTGVAAGTVVARCVGAVVMLAVLGASKSELRLRPAAMIPHAPTVRRILRIGGPALADGLVMWIGHFAFMMIITRLGSTDASTLYYTAHIIGIRIESLSYLPAFAWAAAAATLVGQGLGASDPDRARRAGHEAALQGTIVITLAGVIYFLFAPQLYAAFTLYGSKPVVPAEAVREIGVPALRMVAFFQPALALVIVYVGALRGAGDTRYPFLFTLVGISLVRLPLAYVCGHVLDGGLRGAWVGMCGDLTLRAVMLGVRFARGGWVKTRV